MTLRLQESRGRRPVCALVIATRSPILVALANSMIYSLSDEGVAHVEFDEVPNVQLYRSILGHPDRYLHYLLAEE